MAGVKSTRPDPGGMKKAFKTPVPSTQIDEEKPKEDDGGFFGGGSLGAKINKGIESYKPKKKKVDG